tara:strand:+ start:1018 stop:1308 length:291 start_codon:yes stop_codon:yes gene_type:complete
VTVVEFGGLYLLGNLGMILQHHNITGHEGQVQLVRYLHCLFCSELIRFRYQYQHVLLVEVEVPYVCEYCAELADAVQLQKLDLAVHYGLLCEWTWR